METQFTNREIATFLKDNCKECRECRKHNFNLVSADGDMANAFSKIRRHPESLPAKRAVMEMRDHLRARRAEAREHVENDH